MSSTPALQPSNSEIPPFKMQTSTGPARSRWRFLRADGPAMRGVIATIVFLVVWELMADFVIRRALFIVGPIRVVDALLNLVATGELQMHMLISTREFLFGFAFAVLVGIPVGLILGTSDAAKQYLDPLMNGLFATPLIALAPLFILWFGVGEVKTVVLVFILCVLPIIINTDTGVRSTDAQLLEAARSFGANRLQRFTRVQIPWALSFILTGIRLAIGRGLIGVVAGELFGSQGGVGYLILTSSQLFNTSLVLGGVLIFALTGVLLIYGTEAVGRRIAPWRYRPTRA